MSRTYQPGDLLKIVSDGATLMLSKPKNGAKGQFLYMKENDFVFVLSPQETLQEGLGGWVRVLTHHGVGFVSQFALVEHDLVDE